MPMGVVMAIIVGCLVALYALFILWYGGRGRPLTQAEVDAFIASIQRANGKAGEPEGELLGELRELSSSDDGHEFYMVNLMKFRPRDPANPDSDPLAANTRYNRKIVPLLIKYGGHPVFSGLVQGRFIHTAGADQWDQVAMVRYRSRRDLLKMCIDIGEKNIDQDKWAALEKTQIFPVQPVITLNFVRGTVALILAITAGLFYLASCVFQRG